MLKPPLCLVARQLTFTFYSEAMARFVTAEEIGRSRLVSATAVIDGRAQLAGYPFQHLGVTSDAGSEFEHVSWVLHAVEFLCQHGWDMVNMSTYTPLNTPCAILRRRPTTPHTGGQ